MSRPQRNLIVTLLENLSPLTFISLLVGGTVWLSTVRGLVESSDAKIVRLEVQQDEVAEKLSVLQARIASLEGKIDLMIRQRE